MTDSPRIGRSSTPLDRGNTAPSATKAIKPLSSSIDRSASASWFPAACRHNSSDAWLRAKRLPATIRGRSSSSNWQACLPRTLLPCAGNPTVKRASTVPSSCTCTAVFASTCWPGASIRISPLLPLPRRVNPLDASVANALARKQLNPIARLLVAKSRSGNPATPLGIIALNRLGAANGSPCT